MDRFPALNAGHLRVYHRKMRAEVVALSTDTLYIPPNQTRGGAVWQLVGLITRRSQVQILSPQPSLFQ
jgi:hypothetical protein